EDAVKAWAVAGGVPLYLKELDDRKTPEENIVEAVFSVGRLLFDEGYLLLREELREPSTYLTVLKYIALGYASVGKLSSATGMDKGNLMKYLHVLEALRLVKHVDLDIKNQLLEELKILHNKLGFTLIYVTHDRFEAVEIGDRIALMKDGQIIQVGRPIELYKKPRNRFVAEFFGEANIVPAAALGLAERGYAVIRPEDVVIGGGTYRFKGQVVDITFLWHYLKVEIQSNGYIFKAYVDLETPISLGEVVEFGWDARDMYIVAE
ncbi:MAG: TOBE domain-containing protein, partial [Pyrobaculum sp.]